MSDVDLITKLVMHGTSEEVRGLSCPQCSSSLRLSVYRGGRLVSAKIKCKKCDFIARLDGVPPEPSWVAELGSEFETTP